MDFAQSEPTTRFPHSALLCANTSKDRQDQEGSWREGVVRQKDSFWRTQSVRKGDDLTFPQCTTTEETLVCRHPDIPDPSALLACCLSNHMGQGT